MKEIDEGSLESVFSASDDDDVSTWRLESSGLARLTLTGGEEPVGRLASS